MFCIFFFFQAEDGIRDYKVTGVQTCALPISGRREGAPASAPRLFGEREARDQRHEPHAAGASRDQAGGPALEHDQLLGGEVTDRRSEEHTSELQSPCNLVCRLLLEKKKKKLMRST